MVSAAAAFFRGALFGFWAAVSSPAGSAGADAAFAVAVLVEGVLLVVRLRGAVAFFAGGPLVASVSPLAGEEAAFLVVRLREGLGGADAVLAPVLVAGAVGLSWSSWSSMLLLGPVAALQHRTVSDASDPSGQGRGRKAFVWRRHPPRVRH